jgi:hypothetical protein
MRLTSIGESAPSQAPAERTVPPLIGRTSELARIEAALAEVPIIVIAGLPGSGKTALAAAATGRWRGPVVKTAVAAGADLDAVAAALGSQLEAPQGELRLANALAALGELLDREQALAQIDDVHELTAADQKRLGELGRTLGAGRVLATSRRLPPAGQPGLLTLHLRALEPPAVRQLWRERSRLCAVDSLNGSILRRVRGNPAALERACGGQPDSGDPAPCLVAALARAELEAAVMLLAAHVPLPMALWCGPATGIKRAAAELLVERLVVIAAPDRTCTVDDQLADALSSAVPKDQRRVAHGRIQPVVAAYLREHGAALLEAGDPAGLVEAIEELPRPLLDPTLRLLGASAKIELLELASARRAVTMIRRAAAEPNAPEIRLLSGRIALLGNDLNLALTELAPRERGPQSSTAQRLHALAQTLAGRGAAVRRELAHSRLAARSATTLELDRALALSAWWDEADEELTRALTRLPTEGAGLEVSLLKADLAGRQGRFDEAETQLLPWTERIHPARSPRAALWLAAVRARIDAERGERLRALVALEDVGRSFDAAHEQLGRLWARIGAGRVLLLLGRRTEGWRTLLECKAAAIGSRLPLLVTMVDRSREQDPLHATWAIFEEGLPRAPAQAVRLRMAGAFQAAISGQSGRARGLLATPVPATTDFAFERLLGQLAEAALARLSGSPEAATRAFARAASAIGEGVDSRMADALIRTVQRPRLVTTEQRRVTLAPAVGVRASVVLDGRTHELRADPRKIDLARRPMLRQLLYVLAAQPDQVVSRGELAQALWHRPYRRAVHDNPLKVNVRNLRRLIEPVHINIRFEDGGYRLIPPFGFMFVEPNEPRADGT